MSVLDNIIEKDSFVINSVGHTIIDKEFNWNDCIASYPYYRIYYVVEAKNVKLYLDNSIIELKSGYLYFIPSYSVIRAEYEYLDHFWVHFQFSSSVNNILDYITPNSMVKVDSNIEGLYYVLYGNYTRTEVACRFKTSGAFKLLFSKLLDGVQVQEERFLRFKPVLDYIEQNISREIKIQDLANIMFMNKVYFSNSFKCIFGVAPIQYIKKKRIDLAKRLLLTTKMSINEISGACGFVDPLYFSRCFSQQTQMSPKVYRNIVPYINASLPNGPK